MTSRQLPPASRLVGPKPAIMPIIIEWMSSRVSRPRSSIATSLRQWRLAARPAVPDRLDRPVDGLGHPVRGDNRRFAGRGGAKRIGEEQRTERDRPIGELGFVVYHHAEIFPADPHRDDLQEIAHGVEPGAARVMISLRMACGDRPDCGFYLVGRKGAQHRRLHPPIVGSVLHAENEVRAAGDLGHLRTVRRFEFVLTFENVADVVVPRHQHELAEARDRPEAPKQRKHPAWIVQKLA